MSLRIIFFHDDDDFREPVRVALSTAGYEVAAFRDSGAAWDFIKMDSPVDLLIPRIGSPAGSVPGASLARHLRVLCPWAPVLFTASPENAQFADGIGEVLVLPATPGEIVEAATRLMGLNKCL